MAKRSRDPSTGYREKHGIREILIRRSTLRMRLQGCRGTLIEDRSASRGRYRIDFEMRIATYAKIGAPCGKQYCATVSKLFQLLSNCTFLGIVSPLRTTHKLTAHLAKKASREGKA